MSLSKAQRLAQFADNAAIARGHELKSWRWQGTDTRMTGEAYCALCGMAAMVDTKPADVGGEAIALNCCGSMDVNMRQK